MQIDFHYYCVAVLARSAGFNSLDALAVAYASQYVDDSTESDLIPVKSGGKFIKFDPVLTSYNKFNAWKSMGWSAQKRVWIPFHFLPAAPFDPQGTRSYSFITRPGSEFGKQILHNAAREPLENHKRRLCRIGVALHSFADSWAHAGFSGRDSGRKESEENNVEDISTFDRVSKKWNPLLIENLVLDIPPRIGHAQAAQFPDLSFLKWKLTLSGEKIERDNHREFLKAAENIYILLLGMEKGAAESVIAWEDIRPRISKLFAQSSEITANFERLAMPADKVPQAQDVTQRCENWKKEFGNLFGEYGGYFSYNRNAWWKDAFGENAKRLNNSQRNSPDMKPFTYQEGFWDSYWVHFHRAALTQRHFVLENIP